MRGWSVVVMAMVVERSWPWVPSGQHSPRLVVRLRASPPETSGSSLRRVLEEAGASRAETSRATAAGLEIGSSYDGAVAVARWLVECGGFTGSDVAQMLSSCPALLRANATTVGEISRTVEYLVDELGMKKGEMRRVARAQPQLLLSDDSTFPIFDTGVCPAVLATSNCGPLAPRKPLAVRDLVDLLRAVGIREKHIKAMVVRWPQLVDIDVARMLAVTDFLGKIPGFWDVKTAAPVGLGSLYRQAPWLLAANVAEQLAPAIDFLAAECGVADLEKVVRAHPRCLIADVDEMRAVILALRDFGVPDAALGRVVESFPLVFGLDPRQMAAAVDYWRDLGVTNEDVARICRAFPSLLGVNLETMKLSVAFLREIGVNNLGRFVTRLPPVLAYDVDTVLRPKMQFAVLHALSVYDVVRFPAYFSYPLDTVIAPRAEFLAATGNCKFTLVGLGLNIVLTPSDADFARLVNATPQAYADFKRARPQPPPAPPRQRRPSKPPPPSSPNAPRRTAPETSTSPPAADNSPPPDTDRRPFPKMSRLFPPPAVR